MIASLSSMAILVVMSSRIMGRLYWLLTDGVGRRCACDYLIAQPYESVAL